MKKSGLYKLEDNSYEFVCGGKIVFDAEIDLDKNEGKLTISEAEDIHEVGAIGENKGGYSVKDNPVTYIIFNDKKSVEAMIYQLEYLKENLK